MKRRLLTAAAALALTLSVAGCGDDAGSSTSDSSTAPIATASATPTATPAAADGSGTVRSVADPNEILRVAGYEPRAFSSTEDLLSQTFPGLAATDPVCLQPFGSDWAADPSLALSVMAWGPATDFATAAAITHTVSTDEATNLLDAMRSAVANCAADGGAFSVHDIAVDMTVSPIETGLTGVDDSAGWTASSVVSGTEYTLVGMTARVGSTVAIVLSTSPSTTAAEVAAKLEQLTDQL